MSQLTELFRLLRKGQSVITFFFYMIMSCFAGKSISISGVEVKVVLVGFLLYGKYLGMGEFYYCRITKGHTSEPYFSLTK